MKLSEHFDLEEFECHDGTDVPQVLYPAVEQLVANILEPIRRAWNEPIIVVSGYRTRVYNAKVGGARNSAHCEGMAADIRPILRTSTAALHAFILGMYERGELPALGGLGKYRGWVHVDTRVPADGHLRRWSGRGVGSEPSSEG